jgi:hypothetical protein
MDSQELLDNAVERRNDTLRPDERIRRSRSTSIPARDFATRVLYRTKVDRVTPAMPSCVLRTECRTI